MVGPSNRQVRGCRFDRNEAAPGRLSIQCWRDRAGRADETIRIGSADVDVTEQIDDAIEVCGQPGDETVEFRRAANARLVEASGDW